MIRRLGRSGSNLVAAGIFLSRIAGVIREQAISFVLGNSTGTEAFRFAMRIPNLLQNLLGEGALSASFIPVYARLVEDGEEGEADRLAGAVGALLAAITVVLVGLIVLLARPIVWLFTSWETNPELYELAIDLTRITTVGLGFLVLSAWCLGILNSHRRFFLPYVAPVVWNGFQIGALALAVVLSWTETGAAIAVAWAVVLGGLAQLAIQVPTVLRLAPHLRLSMRRTPDVSDVLSRFVPAVGSRGVVQISSLVDTVLAGALVVGALSTYTFALPLYLLPISLFGFSVAASELAEMSRRSGATEAVSARVVPALRRVLVPAAFVTAAYLAASLTFVDALYGWLSRTFGGEFTEADVVAVGLVLTAFGLGLPAAMTARITQNTLYALGEVRGPAKIAAVRLVVSAAAALVLMLQLDWLQVGDSGRIVEFGDVPHWPPWDRVPTEARAAGSDAEVPHLGAVGLALGASAAAWVEWVLLRRLLARRLGHPVRSGWGRIVAVAGATSWLVMVGAARLPIPSPLDAIAVVGLGGVTYLGGLWLQGVRSPAQLASKP